MVAFWLARSIGVIAKLRQFLVESLERSLPLLQQIVNEGLLAVLQGLLLVEKFFDVVAAALVWHSAYFTSAGAAIAVSSWGKASGWGNRGAGIIRGSIR